MTKGKNDANPALEMAKEQQGGTDKIVTLPNGDTVSILPVSATLLDEVTARIIDPDPPMFFNEKKEREEPNPSDPKYIQQLEENDRKRVVASMDVMTMFGLELLSGIPESDMWIRKLKMLEKIGHIDLSSYDFDDDLDKEFVYKRYIVLNADIIKMIGAASGLTDEEVAKAEATFQGDA